MAEAYPLDAELDESEVLWVAFPLYAIVADVSVSHDSAIGPLERALLRGVASGLYDVNSLARLTGLDSRDFGFLLRREVQADLVGLDASAGRVRLTPRGREALRDARVSQRREESFSFYMDALTGDLFAEVDDVLTREEADEAGLPAVPGLLERPSRADLATSHLQAIRDLYTQVRFVDRGRHEGAPLLTQIVQIRTMPLRYRARQVLRTGRARSEYVVMEKKHVLREHTQQLQALIRQGRFVLESPEEADDEASGPDLQAVHPLPTLPTASSPARPPRQGVLPGEEGGTGRAPAALDRGGPEPPSTDVRPDPKASPQKGQPTAAEPPPERAALERPRLLRTKDHRTWFKKVLREAREHVVIISPWMAPAIVGSYLPEMEKTLRRGVRVTIVYGLDESGSDPQKQSRSQRARELLERELRQYDSLLEFQYHGNMHSKGLICDDAFAIMGSFNWLSFSGKTSRKEHSHVIWEPEIIRQFKGDFLPVA